MSPRARWDGDVLVLSVRVSPRAGSDEITGYDDGSVKLRVRAVPAGGLANRAVIQVLADSFGVPKSRVAITGGPGARAKVVRVTRPGVVPEALRGAIPAPEQRRSAGPRGENGLKSTKQ